MSVLPDPVTARIGASSADWIVRPRPRARARMSLVCFHSAGSGAAMFRRWPERLPDDIDVVLVRMPGRESRLTEPALDDFDRAAAALATALGEQVDGPYALLGHSMGAHLAYAVAAARVAAGLAAPGRLFLCGTRPPHLFRLSFTADSSDAELVDVLARLGGTDPWLLGNEEVHRIILPTLRADLRVCAGIGPPRQPLPVALSVFGGEQDDIPVGELDQWRRWSTGPAETTMFGGRHFFLTEESEDAVLRRIVQTLDADGSSPGAPAA